MKKQDIYKQCYNLVEAAWLDYYSEKSLDALTSRLKSSLTGYLKLLDEHFGVPVHYELEKTYLDKVDKKIAFYEYAWEYEKAYRDVAIDISDTIGVSNIVKAFFEHGDRAANNNVASLVAIADAYEELHEDFINHARLWRERAAYLGDVDSMKWLVGFYNDAGHRDIEKANEWQSRVDRYYNTLS